MHLNKLNMTDRNDSQNQSELDSYDKELSRYLKTDEKNNDEIIDGNNEVRLIYNLEKRRKCHWCEQSNKNDL